MTLKLPPPKLHLSTHILHVKLFVAWFVVESKAPHAKLLDNDTMYCGRVLVQILAQEPVNI